MNFFHIISQKYPYDQSSIDLFDSWDSRPDQSILVVYDDLIKGLKADDSLAGGGNKQWDCLEALWILMGHSRQASYINIRYPSSHTITDGVQPYHTPFQGITGDGSTMYVNLNWNPTSHATVLSQNSACIGGWTNTNVAGTGALMGAFGASNNGFLLRPRTATDIIQGACNGSNTNIGTGGSTTDSRYFKSIRRDNSTQIKTNKDGVDTNTNSSSSTSIINRGLTGLARDNNGTITDFYNGNIEMIFIANGNIDSPAFYNRYVTFRL